MRVKETEASSKGYAALPLQDFLEMVGSSEPAPGGGAVCAVASSLAAALAEMASRFSEKHLDGSHRLVQRAKELREEALPLAGRDAESYKEVLAAYRLPKEDPQRKQKIREALSRAADVPLQIADISCRTAALASTLSRSGNPNLKGDAVAAVLLAEATVKAAANLAEINLKQAGLSDDPRLKELGNLQEEAKKAREEALSPEVSA
ncbi:MAG: cyclodeaminase/cyclohydrolase family protein [Rubrobacteraceae bacterium]|nr:cyclodeaminase/cyclohydrolase family protein [Rubrobacteraceae bacterium]